MYADMDAILAENPDNKRKSLATRCSSPKNNPSCKRELTLPKCESSTYDLESDNPYYGGIVPPENIQDGSSSSKGSHQNTMGEDDYAEIENTPSDFNSPKRTGSAAEHSSVSTNVAFDNPAYGSNLPLDRMKGYKNSVHNPVCDDEYSCVTTNALTGNASHLRKASNDGERNKHHTNRKNTGKSPYNVSKNVVKKPFGRNQSPIYNALDDNPGHDDDFSVYERPEENEQPLSVALSNNLPLYEVLQNQDTFNHQPLNSSYTETNHGGTVFQSHNKRRETGVLR